MKPFTTKPAPWGKPALIGIPLDHNSSFLRGPAQAPPLIRRGLHSDAWNKTTETRVDLGVPGIFEDAGDLTDMEAPDAFTRIEATIAGIVESGEASRQPRRRSLHHVSDSACHRNTYTRPHAGSLRCASGFIRRLRRQSTLPRQPFRTDHGSATGPAARADRHPHPQRAPARASTETRRGNF